MAAKRKEKTHNKVTKETIFFVVFVTLWAALSLVASQFITAFLLRLLVGDNLGQPFWVLVYYIISYICALALILLVPPRLRQLYRKSHPGANTTKATSTKSKIQLSANRSELGLASPPTLTDIGLAPVGYIVYAIFANILTALFSIFSWFNIEESQDVGFGYFITTADRFFAMFAIVLIAPIAEEIIMRGWLYDKLRSRTGIIVAIIITSLTFAILHGQWNVAVVTFALSSVLCGMREITGTIWSGIILHILVNGIAFYLRYVAQII